MSNSLFIFVVGYTQNAKLKMSEKEPLISPSPVRSVSPQELISVNSPDNDPVALAPNSEIMFNFSLHIVDNQPTFGSCQHYPNLYLPCLLFLFNTLLLSWLLTSLVCPHYIWLFKCFYFCLSVFCSYMATQVTILNCLKIFQAYKSPTDFHFSIE